jgi:hypothetical protein
MRIISVTALAAVLALVAGTGAHATSATSLTIKMGSLNDSDESGTAVFIQQADGLHVVMALAGAPKDIPQPANLHVGTCDKNKATQWVLSNVVNGKSETTLKGISLSDLTSGGYVINVHESANNLSYYVACGTIK